MSFHTKRSPSQAKRFLACAGTFALCDSLPEEHHNQSGIAAQIGTAAHGLIERCLREHSNPEDYRDRIIELVGDEESVSILRSGAKTPSPGRVFFIVDSDMIDGTEMMVTYIHQRCKELGVEESSLQLETRTNPLPDRDDTSGTADVTIDSWPTLLEVVDYKNGWNVVEHTDNEQLMAYLLGKALEGEWSHEEYMVTVVQPNAPHEEGRIRSFKATKNELLVFQKRYRAGIERCEKSEDAVGAPCRDNSKDRHHYTAEWADKWLAAGDHCLFCNAQAVCPAAAKLATERAQIDFAEEPRALEHRPDPEAVAQIMRWAPFLESLIRAANGYAQREMEAGHSVPGFKLVRGRSTRRWGDMPEDVIVKEILRGKFITDKERLFSSPKLVSGPQAVKLVEKNRRGEFEELFLIKPEGNLTVAPDDDPRERVERSAGDDFEDDLDFG